MPAAKTSRNKPPTRRQRPEEEVEENLDEMEPDGDVVDEEDEEEEPKRGKSQPKFKESKISIQAKKEKKEPEARDKRKRVKIKLTALRLGFDGLRRIRPGMEFEMKVPLDDEGAVILPTWACLPEDYVPEPEPELPPGMKPRKVSGGVFKGGVGGGRMEL